MIDSNDYTGVEPTLEVKYALAVAEVERLRELHKRNIELLSQAINRSKTALAKEEA